MMSSPKTTKRLHISFTPTLPSGTPSDISSSLSAHLGKFGTVRSIDGFGDLDSVGRPKKFGFVSVEGTETGIAKCVNSLSGSIWKGVKVRVGDAKPDFEQRIALERDVEPRSRKKQRRAGGVYANDMSLVSRENVSTRPGWKVTEMGRILRPAKMRPARPLPEPLPVSGGKQVKHKDGRSLPKKKRKKPEVVTRARIRTIDMTRWRSVHLKGIFLESAGQSTDSPGEGMGTMQVVEDEDEDEDENEANTSEADAGKVETTTKTERLQDDEKFTRAPSMTEVSIAEAPMLPEELPSDLAHEKTQSLSLIRSLFGDNSGQWGGRESVGSDIDEAELLRPQGPAFIDTIDVEFEVVPMEVDDVVPVERQNQPQAIAAARDVPEDPRPPKPHQASKLKDLFAPREEDTGFSLIGHLDVDLELDENVFVNSYIPSELPAQVTPADPVTLPAAISTVSLDPQKPLFFPLASSYASSSSLASMKARQRDIFDVAKDNGWNISLSASGDEIRARWESEKAVLTREWKRRWREAGKVRRRRGGDVE